MKRIFLLAVFTAGFAVLQAQTPVPVIKVYINNREIDYVHVNNNTVHKEDIIYFDVYNKADKAILEVDSFSILYFFTSVAASKELRQSSLFTKNFAVKDHLKNRRITIPVKEILAQHAFTKIDIGLDKLYQVRRNIRSEVPLHSSKRSFSFSMAQ